MVRWLVLRADPFCSVVVEEKNPNEKHHADSYSCSPRMTGIIDVLSVLSLFLTNKVGQELCLGCKDIGRYTPAVYIRQARQKERSVIIGSKDIARYTPAVCKQIKSILFHKQALCITKTV